ncbi:ATP-grasp domain-containing protein [Marinomonas fungiae]|uniref:RimK-like ATP-grasp domain n=1 Tax=Marinomonas fungiae TaxID=1137284 RepID=A0A0K6IK10_9GAMM|nr:alpha-L-glutamate ligase [Marinomonas fungiae]CUB03421.1 RimK-like ATP-grasp domain [Marinomonas fungiae]
MKIVSFDALRTLHLPNVHYIKPENMFGHLDVIREADWVLFPEYWQLNALVHGLKKRIFPSLASYMIGHDKVEMTRTFMTIIPMNHPYTEICANTPYEAERIWDTMPTPFVAKIPRSSMGNGVFLIDNPVQWRDYTEKSPIIYAQEYLPIDRDLRIVWVGNEVVGGYWRLQAEQGFYNNVSQGGKVEVALIPKEALDLVEYVATSLGIDHGGFDVAMVGSIPYLIEFNRIFGNQGVRDLQQSADIGIMKYLTENLPNDFIENQAI